MQCIASHQTSATASSLAWHPTGNALAMGLESGAVTVWSSPVPEAMTGPVGEPEMSTYRAVSEGEEDGLEDSGGGSQDGADAAAFIIFDSTHTCIAAALQWMRVQKMKLWCRAPLEAQLRLDEVELWFRRVSAEAQFVALLARPSCCASVSREPHALHGIRDSWWR